MLVKGGPGHPEPVKQPWRMSVNESQGSDNVFIITQMKQSATKPHVYVIMMTSSNISFSALLAHCAGNSSVIAEFPSQRTSNADLMFLWCEFTHAVKQAVEWPVIWEYMKFMSRHRNDGIYCSCCMTGGFNAHSATHEEWFHCPVL